MTRGRKKLPKHYQRGFLVQMSRQSSLGKRLNDTFASLIADSGGPGRMTTGRLMLAERMTFLDEVLRQIERDMVESDDPKIRLNLFNKWTQGINSLVGLVRAMGFDKPLDDPIDVLYRDPENPEPEEQESNGSPKPVTDDEDDWFSSEE